MGQEEKGGDRRGLVGVGVLGAVWGGGLHRASSTEHVVAR